MFDVLREKPFKSAVILLIPVLIAAVYMALAVRLTLHDNDGYVGALLDDTWIHIRFADHISRGEGLAYNDGIVTTGATSPLWVLLLGTIYAVIKPDITGQLHIAIGMSALGQLLLVTVTTGFGWWVTHRAWIGLLAGLITALTGRLVWMGLSGMEITTFTALCVLALWSHTHDVKIGRVFGWRTGIITALATLGRPEGYLLAVLIGADAFVFVPLRERIIDARNYIHSVVPGWRGILAYVLLAGSYPLAAFLVSGYPLPNTFRVKSRLGQETPDLPYAYFWTPRVDHGWILITLMFIGIAFLIWRAWTKQERSGFAWILWAPLFVIAVLFMGSQHFVVTNSRYVAPAIPFHALLASVGVWAVTMFAPRLLKTDTASSIIKIVPVALATLLLVFTIAYGADHLKRVSNDVSQLRKMHVAAGEWFKANTTPDQLIALNDVGAIVHISDRKVLDLVGLVSPEALEAVKGTERYTCSYDLALARLMLKEKPVLVGIFPWWYPCLSEWPQVLQPYIVFAITGPTVIGGGEMVIYTPQWEMWPMQEAIPDDVTLVNQSFEQGITLAGYDTQIVENGLEVTLWWLAEAKPEGDYTAFIHLIDSSGEIITQSDSIPQNGRFNTEWWQPGDIIWDTRLLEIDPQQLDAVEQQLRIGLYPTGGGTRLPRITAPIDEPDFVILPFEP